MRPRPLIENRFLGEILSISTPVYLSCVHVLALDRYLAYTY
jgi:hypothetical protein